jgi:hypothetical protein
MRTFLSALILIPLYVAVLMTTTLVLVSLYIVIVG